nr:MAG TPA: hypothetical protein [Caudoviricetes sp.]
MYPLCFLNLYRYIYCIILTNKIDFLYIICYYAITMNINIITFLKDKNDSFRTNDIRP